MLNKFFSDCRYVPQLRRYCPTKLCDGAQMAIFGDFFCVLCFSARRVPQVSDLHLKFALRSHHVWKYGTHPIIQSAAAEIRRGKKKRKEERKKERKKEGKKEDRNHREKNIMVCPITQGDHNESRYPRDTLKQSLNSEYYDTTQYDIHVPVAYQAFIFCWGHKFKVYFNLSQPMISVRKMSL